MKIKKFLVLLLVFAVMISGFGSTKVAKAADIGNLVIDEDFSRLINADPGRTIHIKMPIRATSYYGYTPIIVTDFDSGAPFTTSSVRLTDEGKDVTVLTDEYVYVEFDIYMKDNAKIGNYELRIKYKYDVSDYLDATYLEETHTLNIRVSKEKEPAQLSVVNFLYDEEAAAVGNNFDLSFYITNEGELTAKNTYVSIDYGSGESGTGLVPNYTVENVKVGDLASGSQKKVSLSVKVLPTADAGFTTLPITMTYKDDDGKEESTKKNVYVNIKPTSIASTEDASLVLGNTSLNEEVMAGTEYVLKGTLENIGKKKASNIQITIPEGTGVESGILANFKSDGVIINQLKSEGTVDFSLPLLVAKTAAAGLKEITVQVTFDDTTGESHTIVAKYYLTVVAQDEEKDGEIVMSNVVQSPSSPSVGETIAVAFTLENKGSKPVTDVVVAGKDLLSSGFEPLTADAEVRVGEIKAGESKNVTLNFKVSSGAAEGMNSLTLTCAYKDNSGKAQSQDALIYILNVQNSSNSKPKLIVSDFSVDSEELRAGTEFNFTFDIKNTHSTKAAKNIKVTISQKDNVFSASQGSNSFYIEQIRAGEVSTNVMPMKVKPDTATGAYELSIAVEYEYDDMSKVDAEAGGVKDENLIKLQAVENSRPVIENITIGTWDMPTLNQSTGMSFEFYNMGKSTLDNVYFTFEGDFKLEGGEKLILGSVQAGYSEFVDPNVIPLVEGMAKGTIVIHFENSNGEEITVTKEIPETFVQGEMIMDDPGMWDIPAMGDDVANMKKDIVPLWLFLVIQAGILVVFIPFVRYIGIRIYKRKLMKNEDRI